MPFQITTDVVTNDAFELSENGDGDLVLEHSGSGATLTYDSSEGAWVPSGGLGGQNNVVDTIETDTLSIAGWNKVDVTERGVDNTGSSDVAADIESLIQPRRVLVFPAGTYRVDSTIDVSDPCALIAKGGATLEANTTMLFSPGTQSTPLGDFALSGFEITNPGGTLERVMASAVATDSKHVYSGLVVADQLSSTGDAGAFRIDAADDSKAIARDITATAGSPGGSSNGGFLTYADGYGSLIRIENSNIQNFDDNGIYGSNGGGITTGYDGEGRLEVVNTVSKNNRVSNLRANGVNCKFEGCYAAVDSTATRTTFTSDLLKLREGDQHLIENCRLRADNPDASGRLINKEATSGRVTINNCLMEDVGSDYEVNEETRTHSRPSQMVIKDSQITSTGGALTGTFVRLGNDGSELRNCHIDLDSAVTGVYMAEEYTRVTGCVIRGSASNAIRIGSPYTAVESNPFIGTSDTYTIRINDNTGDVRIADNTLQEFAIRNDAGNTVIDRDNWIVTSQPSQP